MSKLKNILVFLCSISFLLFSYQFSFSQEEKLESLDKKETQIKEVNLSLALKRISDYYQSPIGFEFSKNGKDAEQISVDISDKTFRQAITAVVEQDTRYEWKNFDGVINVYPKENRDYLLKNFLETKVSSFTISEKSSIYKVKNEIVNIPEIVTLFKSTKTTPFLSGFFGWDFTRIGRSDYQESKKQFSLNLSNVTIREILNRLVKDSNRKYWVVNRDVSNSDFWVNF